MSAANSWAGAARGFWTAEMHRQQTQVLNGMTEQMMKFWTGAWALPAANNSFKTRR